MQFSLNFARSPGNAHHSEAAHAKCRPRERDAGESDCCVGNQVLREYMVTLSRPGTFKSPPSMSVLIKTIRGFRRTFRMAVEVGTTDALLMVMGRVHVSGRQIHDANIVATMLTNNLKNLLTHNVEDFRRYVPLVTVIPLT